ncbi:Phosphoribosylformylglycinamidine synthase 1 [Candidatus Terasakiella magnetica]|uniref:Phosphoribosylformylglycinamidine synthase subunit PurQ n=1 Tax=Candidatus Terasakiella magnetica TaxID=1867952 RepID=A0A1C3RM14_9PROT|nr:phosphoribosylformylglycinamidine synthase subunit PurQ [Candidatus Terasakiella magnetica]SCA58303.1 Phosphoribosylformylglycinamidine synthase 1 [Candidatus Terasakiella magnetica]
MKAAVIVFPGSNCDRDMLVGIEHSLGRAPEMVWHKETELPDVDFIAVPGGFSYGDALRCGAMSAHSPIMREVVKKANQGVRVLGVCNGFQILTEAGLLPGVLMRNAKLKFICKDVHLKVENAETEFTNKYSAGQAIRIPVAHHDGNFHADSDVLAAIEENNQVAFRYCDEAGNATPEANINGSRNNIAGIFNEKKNILGMMPHPERLCEEALGGTDGKPMFDALVEALS